MPRNGSGVYSLPPGSSFTPNTLIQSSVVNGINNDLATDLNLPRPIVAGGTGASDAASARISLGVPIEKIDTGNLAGLTTKTILLPSVFTTFNLVINNLNLTDGSLPFWIQTSIDGGSTFSSGASDYTSQYSVMAGAAASLANVSEAAIRTIDTSLSTTDRVFISSLIDPGSLSMPASFLTSSKWVNAAAALRRGDYVGIRNSLARINAIRIFPGASTIATGTYTLYGNR